MVSACASLSSEYLDSVRICRGFEFFVRTVGPRCWSSYVIIVEYVELNCWRSFVKIVYLCFLFSAVPWYFCFFAFEFFGYYVLGKLGVADRTWSLRRK